MSVGHISKALVSTTRQRILDLLMKRSMGVGEICKAVQLQATAVRYHLRYLMSLNLLEAEEKPSAVGRPKVVYRAARRLLTMSFPARQYMLLSDLLLGGLQDSFGEGPTREYLSRISSDFAKQIVRDLTSREGVKVWTPGLFARYFVEGVMKEYETQPELLEISEKKVVYREHNCLFKELALKYPSLVCDTMDEALHRTICKAMGKGVKSTRLRCMGHGDPSCEYQVEWGSVS